MSVILKILHINQEVEETNKMARWRNIKHNKVNTKQEESKEQKKETFEDSCAPLPNRIKAFIVDMFMIMMPIMYITTYLIMDGKDDFQGSEEARWITMLVYGFIIILFWKIKGQTPGFKAYELKLVDVKTKENISLFKGLFRYFVFLLSAVSVILAFLPFFRKDKKSVQDIVCKTLVIPHKS